MKNALSLLVAALCLATLARATTPTLTSITQPLYYLGAADGPKIQYIAAPKILNNNSARFWIGLFSSPTKAEGGREDLNLISIYKIAVSLTRQDKDGSVREITIDLSGAKKPERFPLTVVEVGRAAAKAVRMEFKDEKKTKIVLTDGTKVYAIDRE